MTNYIPADKLIAEIEQLKDRYGSIRTRNSTEECYQGGRLLGYTDVIEKIHSLRQEQPESSKGEFVFPNFLYARTVDNKTIDVSYAPQSMDAVEYIKNDPTEQSEADLEEEMDRFFEEMPVLEHENIFEETYQMIARHFYEFRKNSK